MRIPSLALALVAAVAAAAPGETFTADFRRDPARQGFTVSGEQDGRFAFLRGRGLLVSLDSNAPSARLLAPLGMTLDGTTSFRLEAGFQIEALEASPDDFFQLAFGLCNLSTTGLNRTGTSLPAAPFFVDDSDVFDSVEIAYYPNVTFFGGPFIQPTVFGAARGSAFANFAANFGPSADLGDNGPGEIRELPQGRPLRVEFAYDACTQLLTTRFFDAEGELATGLQPLDLSVLNATGTFTVDAFALHAYQDLADFDPSTRSLAMDISFSSVSVERLEPVTARLLPRALNASASAPAYVRIDRAAEGATAELVVSGGVAVNVPLELRATGKGLVAEIPRDMALPPLMLRVNGCDVPVDGPKVIVPR